MGKAGLWHRYAAVAYGAIFLGVIGHATTEFVAVLSGVAGAELSVWRFLIGGAGLVIVSLLIPSARDLITPLKQDPWAIVGLSIGMICIGYLLFHLALDYATVPQVATTVTAAPIYVALVNRWLNKEAITKAKWVTGIAALVAVALLLTDGALTQLAGGGRNLFGIALVICSSFLIGGFMVVAKPYIGKYGALRITTLSTALSGIGLWLIVGIAWGNWVNPAGLFDRPSGQWLSLLAIGLLNTHPHPVALARRSCGGARSHPRHVSLLPEAGDRRRPRSPHPRSARDRPSVVGDPRDLRRGRARSILGPALR